MTTIDKVKLEKIFAKGLCKGLGNKKQTCIEGAIALACREKLSLKPKCVAKPDRIYSIVINDSSWSSPEVRADALLPLALAQVGTAGTDRMPWVKLLIIGLVKRVLPLTFEILYRKYDDSVSAMLHEQAEKLRLVTTFEDVKSSLAAVRANIKTNANVKAAANIKAPAPANVKAAYVADGIVSSFCVATNSVDIFYISYAAAETAEKAAEVIAKAAANVTKITYERDRILLESVAVALDAYRAEGRGV